MTTERVKSTVYFPVVGSDQLACFTAFMENSKRSGDGYSYPDATAMEEEDAIESLLADSRAVAEGYDDRRAYQITVGFDVPQQADRHTALTGQSYSLAVVIADKLCRYRNTSENLEKLPTIVASAGLGKDGAIAPLGNLKHMAHKLDAILLAMQGEDPLLKPGDYCFLSDQEEVNQEQIDRLKSAGLNVRCISNLRDIAWLWLGKRRWNYLLWITAAAVSAMVLWGYFPMKDEPKDIGVPSISINCDAPILDSQALAYCGGVESRYDLVVESRRFDPRTQNHSPWSAFSGQKALLPRDQFKLRFDIPHNDNMKRHLFIYSQYANGDVDVADLIRMPQCSNGGCGPFTMDDAVGDVLYFVARDKADRSLDVEAIKALPKDVQNSAVQTMVARLDNDLSPWVKRVVLR